MSKLNSSPKSAASAARRPSYNEKQWEKRVDEQKKSGHTVRAFCQEHGFKESKFWYWKSELRKRRLRRTGKKARGGLRKKRMKLLPVKIVGSFSQAPLELVCSTGRSVRIAGDVPLDLLRKVMAVAEEPR